MDKETLMIIIVILIAIDVLKEGYLKGFVGAFLKNLVKYKKTALAGIQVFRFAHCAKMLIIIPENSIDTFFLDALFTAAGTVFPELNRGVFADWVVPWLCCFYRNMILFGKKSPF